MIETRPVSLKPGLTWSGMTRLTDHVDGDRRFRELRNCYISDDGTEIRRFPGWRLAYDPDYDGALTNGSTPLHFHGFKYMRGGVLCVMAEDDATTAGTGSAHDSLNSYLMFTRGDFTTPPTKVHVGQEVANRYLRTNGTYQRDQHVLPFRGHLRIAEDRVLMNVPGYGCVFQTFIGSPTLGTDNIQSQYAPRCLGLPKGIIQANISDTFVTQSTATPTPTGLEAGQHYIRVAYVDDFTGEVGIASEALQVDTSIETPAPTNPVLSLEVLLAGEVMPEAFGLKINLYASRTDGTKEIMGLIKVLDGSTGTSSSGRNVASFTELSWAESDIDFTQPPRVSDQMPPGCKAMTTVRGFTFFGGFHGDYGFDAQYQLGTVRQRFATDAGTMRTDLSTTDAVKGFGVGGYNIPPAYSGVRFRSDEIFSGQSRAARWSKYVNSPDAGAITAGGSFCYSELVNFPTADSGDLSSSLVELYPERGRLRYSEQANPWSVPAINNIFVDADKGEDIEGLGRYQNNLVICTRTQTFGLAWPRTPQGQNPVKLDSEIGCIAPNSMVEYDGGLAWLSDRGPAAMEGGAPRLIGLDLKDFFVGNSPRYKRDSRGMMYHSFGMHDPERSLVYFGVRRDRVNTDFADNILTLSSYTADSSDTLSLNITSHGLRVGDIFYIEGFDGTDNATDVFVNGFHRVYAVNSVNQIEVRINHSFLTSPESTVTPAETIKVYKNGAMSKIACDELLVWSYRNNSWSIFEVPDGMEMVSMDRIQLKDSSWRTAFMTTNGKVYALEDQAQDSLADHILVSHQSGTGSGNTFEMAASNSNIRVGMNFFVRATAASDEVGFKFNGYITNVSGTTLTLSDSYTRAVGDVGFIGGIPMRMEMANMRLSGVSDDPACIRGLNVRHRQVDSAVPGTYIGMTVESEKDSDMVFESKKVGDTTLKSRLSQGSSRGHELKAIVEVLGSEFFAIQELELAVSDA